MKKNYIIPSTEEVSVGTENVLLTVSAEIGEEATDIQGGKDDIFSEDNDFML